jgi:HPt (histidine-containing phosphotransfer) domain-containing protein
MITMDGLKALGADTAAGLARCINDEGFYLKMVGLALQDANFDQLKEAIDAGDLDAAFEKAHALKGVMGNVGLTSLFDLTSEITEELRARKDIDYSGYIDNIFTELEKYRAL